MVYLNKETPVLSFYQNLSKSIQIRDLSYINDDKDKHKLDLYLPKYVDNFPVVVFVHGGYWTDGDRNYYQGLTGLYGNIGTTLAKNGIGVAVISYRLHPEVSIDDEISDVVSATDWIYKNIKKFGGDNKNIFLMGHSAGGHLVSLAGLDGKLKNPISGIITMSAIYSLNDMVKDNDEKFNQEKVYPIFGEDPKNWQKYSPVNYYKYDSPAVLTMLGENDFDYMKKQVPMYADKINKINSQSQFVSIPHYVHSQMVSEFGKDNDIVSHLVMSFIKRNIKK